MNTSKARTRSIVIWTAVAIVGAVAWGVIALVRGEQISAAWLIAAALGSYAIAYRFYARFIARTVLGADDRRATPGRAARQRRRLPADRPARAVRPPLRRDRRRRPAGRPRARRADGLPAGHDLDHRRRHLRRRRAGHGHRCSSRCGATARSLGQMARDEIGPVGGAAALVAVLAIMVILLAVLALVVVNALANSPWGTFSHRDDDPDRAVHGLLPARAPARAGAGGHRDRRRAAARARSSLGGVVQDSSLADAFTLSPETLASAWSPTASSRRSCRCGCCSPRATTCRRS